MDITRDLRRKWPRNGMKISTFVRDDRRVLTPCATTTSFGVSEPPPLLSDLEFLDRVSSPLSSELVLALIQIVSYVRDIVANPSPICPDSCPVVPSDPWSAFAVAGHHPHPQLMVPSRFFPKIPSLVLAKRIQ